MIPKIIHCCWLGGGPKDALSARCRASWDRFAPEFEIREWDMARLRNAGEDGLPIPPFVQEAIARRKWAFAADWVRFAALYLEGGVYFDYDFELLKPIDDLLDEGAFVAGQWLPDGTIAMEPAILALEKGSTVAKAMLEHYASALFDGYTTVGTILASLSRLSDFATPVLRVLPPEIFSPIDVHGVCHQTAETRGIHHYAMSWAGPKRRIAKWLAWHGGRGFVERLLRMRNWLSAHALGKT